MLRRKNVEVWILDIMEKFGYLGVLILIAIENIFPPIPSEVILTFGGFMTTYTGLSVAGVVWYATLGSIIGAIILYGIGYQLNADRLEILVHRLGPFLRLKISDIQRAEAWFNRSGKWTVFFCRFIPLIRSLISIPAGMARMNFIVFFVFTLLGTLLWNVILVNIGAAVGESWEEIVKVMDVYSNIVYIGLAILLIVLIGLWIKKRQK